MQIIEGELIEFPTADGSGVDRRAFGTFIGRQRTARYAIGWASNADHGRLSIGFDDATFHAVMTCDDEVWTYALSDDPFEELPGCGPHLPTARAAHHASLPMVRRISEAINDDDRRAWWFWHSLLGTRCMVTRPVFELRESVRLVCHNLGAWEIAGKSGLPADSYITRLSQVVDDDHTLLDVLDLACGETATRQRKRGRWTRSRELPYAV